MVTIETLEAFECEVRKPSVPPEDSYRPFVFRLDGKPQRPRLETICRASELQLVDRVGLKGTDGDDERVWVYLPWERKLVSLLGPESYFATITDRNRDKITREEQRLLQSKRVGVVGLSVGAEAAVTIAREHLCGEMVLADFDLLELSNLNRIEAGFDELGQNKARIAARRIAKVNPYSRVTIYEEGVTDDNLEAFMSGLDLLVEECDGLAIKLELRHYCRENRVNLVFAADERGFLSVEPYANDPELLPFHGHITEAQPSRDTLPSQLAFMQELTRWMGGWEAISERSRHSLERLGKGLNGYPQLASEARFAAGQVGHVARRLLLGESVGPFFGHIDLGELVPNLR